MKKKEEGINNELFSYFAFKSKKQVVVIEIPEWKLKAKIARNTTLEENQD